MWQKISNHISETQRIRFRPLKVYPIGGGCINETYQIKDKNQCYFVKLNNENRKMAGEILKSFSSLIEENKKIIIIPKKTKVKCLKKKA